LILSRFKATIKLASVFLQVWLLQCDPFHLFLETLEVEFFFFRLFGAVIKLAKPSEELNFFPKEKGGLLIDFFSQKIAQESCRRRLGIVHRSRKMGKGDLFSLLMPKPASKWDIEGEFFICKKLYGISFQAILGPFPVIVEEV